MAYSPSKIKAILQAMTVCAKFAYLAIHPVVVEIFHCKCEKPALEGISICMTDSASASDIPGNLLTFLLVTFLLCFNQTCTFVSVQEIKKISENKRVNSITGCRRKSLKANESNCCYLAELLSTCINRVEQHTV